MVHWPAEIFEFIATFSYERLLLIHEAGRSISMRL